MNRKKLIKQYRAILVSIAICILFIVVALITSKTQLVSDVVSTYSKMISLSEGWVDELGNDVTLPINIDYERGFEHSYSMILPDSIKDSNPPSMFFTTRYMNVMFYVDDEFIGSCISKPSEEKNSLGKLFKIIPFTQEFSGRTLRMDVELAIGKEASYVIIPPLLGNKSDLLFNSINDELFTLISCIIILCFSFILFILSMQKTHIHQTGNLFKIGTFAFLFASYCLSTSDTARLFIPNSYFIYLFEFLLLATLPIPFISAICDKCTPTFQKILYGVNAILCINLFSQIFIHFLTPLEIRNTVFFTHISILLAIIMMIIALTKGCKDSNKTLIILSVAPAFIGGFIDILFFTFSTNYRYPIFVNLGIIAFMIIQIFYFTHSYLKSYENHIKTEFYQRIAYFDTMTNIRNRTAFEEKILNLKENIKKYTSIWCIVADINNLKKTNDTLGHLTGDKLIKSTATILKTIAPHEDSLYRTGGDEFIIFFTNKSEHKISEKISKLYSLIDEHNKQSSIILSMAVGYTSFNATADDTIEKLLCRADALMFKNKKLMKNVSIRQAKNNG